MESNQKELLRIRQMTFVGKVLAEFTHGTRNYLAIVRESAGWLGDLLGEPGQGTKDDRQQFSEVLALIEKQVKILEQTTEHLSRFGLRMGKESCAFNPKEIVQEAVSFSTRYVRRHEASITSNVTETLPDLHGDPLHLHVLVWVLINDMLQRIGKGGEMTLLARPEGDAVLINIDGFRAAEGAVAPSQKTEAYWSEAQQIAADLGGRLETTTVGSDTERLSLLLPVT